MSLALMIHTDEDALVCDFAETYGILNFYELPVPLMATLCAGLRDDSRIMQKIGGSHLSTKESLMAMMLDGLNWLVWAKTEDGSKNKNRPQSVYGTLQGIKPKGEERNKIEDVTIFDSVDDFESALERIKGGNTWQNKE